MMRQVFNDSFDNPTTSEDVGNPEGCTLTTPSGLTAIYGTKKHALNNVEPGAL